MIKRKPTAAAGILRSSYGGIIRLSDAELLRLRDEATAEIARRCPADHPIDLSDIKGQEWPSVPCWSPSPENTASCC